SLSRRADQDAARQLRDRQRRADARAGAAAQADRRRVGGRGESARSRRRALDERPAAGVEGEGKRDTTKHTKNTKKESLQPDPLLALDPFLSCFSCVSSARYAPASSIPTALSFSFVCFVCFVVCSSISER